MRRSLAIAAATALELLCEPLLLLITLTALALCALAPALHCHQFGEPSRMARDAGFSLILVGGTLYAAFGAFKTFRREIDSGTMQVALAHSVSRTAFFLSKALGCAVAYSCFVLAVASVSLTIVNGAEIGGEIAARNGDVSRIWGGSFAIGLASIVLPLVLGAALNRFARMRFTLTVSLLSLACGLLGTAYRPDAALIGRVLPVALVFAMPPLVVLAAVSAFAVRFREGVTGLLTVAALCLFAPALGGYCLSDVLSQGGRLPPGYLWMALGAIAPAVASFLALGAGLINGRDVA